MAKIVGNVVGLPNPQSDWEQKDETKADYIKNKPNYRNEFSNAITNIKTGNDAFRIEDISPVSTKINVSLKSSNLISMTNALADGYKLPVEHGKTYTISAKLKDEVTIANGAYWGIEWTDDNPGDGTIDHVLLDSSSLEREASSVFTVGVDNSRDYHIYTDKFEADNFEYIQLKEGKKALPYTPYMEKEDLSKVKVELYTKNMFKNDIFTADSWEVFQSYYVHSLPLPDNIPISVSGHYLVTEPNGYIYIQKSVNNGDFINLGDKVLENKTQKNVSFTKQPNEKYRILVTSHTYADIIGGNFLKGIMVELGELGKKDQTEYEEYKDLDGSVPIGRTATLVSKTKGVKITAEYCKDIKIIIAELEDRIEKLENATVNS